MAAVERVLVAQGWHLPRWRTTNKDYGKFYQPHIPTHAPKDPLHFLHRPPHLHHVTDYANCGDQCRPHLRHHGASADMPSSSSSFHDAAAVGPPFVRTSVPAHCGVGLNAHIQHLTLQEERPALLHGPEQHPRMQNRLPDGNHAASTLDDRPPWRPKPLKPMILFEKKAKELEKEKSLDRLHPSYKRKKSGEWLQPPSRPSKRQQVNYITPREVYTMETIHPATRRYSYYKYYGYGGQGAKTSWGHNRPLGQKPPFSRRTQELKEL